MIVGRWYVQLAAMCHWYLMMIFITDVCFDHDCNLNFLCLQRRNKYS